MLNLDRRAFLASGACAAAGACAHAAPEGPGRWEPRASLPWVAQEIYGAVVGDRLFIAGGLVGRGEGPRGVLDRTAIYDARRDAWAEGPRLPAPTHHPMVVAAQGRVFVLGGFREAAGGQWSAVADVLALDGDRWTTAGRMPAPQSETVGFADGARIHLVTGRTPGGTANAQWTDQVDVDAHRVFDTRSGAWSAARPAPTPRNSAAGAVIDGRLYLVGGRTVSGGNMARLDRYDPRSDQWEALRPMPQGAGGLGAAALGGRLYAFGGEWFGPNRAGGVYPETWRYDPATDAWSAVAPMRTPRHGLVGAAVRGQVLAVGGAERVSSGMTSAVVEAFVPG